MQVVASGRESLISLWNRPTPKQTEYRTMRYLIRLDTEKGTLFLNTVTGELVLLAPSEAEKIGSLPAMYSPWMDDLIAYHYLVPVDYDERKSVDQLRKILCELNSDTTITSYSILPTTACNARCFYCFESEEPRYSMTAELADKTVDYIIAHLGESKKVNLKWFGGEPTLGEARIDQICERLSQHGIEFSSTMISNAYLFTKEMIRKAREKWKLTFVQITLDGTEENYNRIKAYVNPVDNPFFRVIGNIELLLEEKIRVSVRMNLDYHNKEDLKFLIGFLGNKFSKSTYFSAYVAPLFENVGFSPVMHTEKERDELSQTAAQLNRLIEQQGCEKSSGFSVKQALPSLRERFCMADNPNSLQVNPLGSFSKCEHDIYGHTVGDIEHGHDCGTENSLYWFQHGYRSECYFCPLYPVCGLADICAAHTACRSEQIEEKLGDIRRMISQRYEKYALENEKEGYTK